ncbi:hypothetical protein F5050DRAFT_1709234 [Lentinula boryana]|uniref:Uncharacterized protein n=1 Tax=Lentinula boryana TaxID=40481 RepID=A0ABQ8QNH0_9AGAR|nr:hypothetical protein F5050DRAFT_1709234 [Lentinula boryana]
MSKACPILGSIDTSLNCRTWQVFDDALHIPDVSYNLVSISKMDVLGYEVLFGRGIAKFFSPSGIHFLTGYGSEGLYQLNEKKEKMQALTVKSQSLYRPVNIRTWH